MQHQRTSSIGHDVVKNDMNQKSLAMLGIFSNSTEKALYACTQKLSKIAAAIHLVSDVIDRDEPLAKSLRDRSVSALQASYRLFDEATKSRPVSRLIISIEELMSLIGIGKIAHHISDMNADILVRELSGVHAILKGEYTILAEQERGYRGRFEGIQPSIPHAVLDDELFDTISRERSIVHKTSSRAAETSFPRPDFKTTFKTTIKDTSNTGGFIKPTQAQSITGNTTVKTTLQKIAFDDRNQGIIEIIKSHRNATIADIKKGFSDMSDKTIQRALAKLINSGAIIRIGNKRWATYRIPA